MAFIKKNTYKVIRIIGFILIATALIMTGFVLSKINNSINSTAIIGGGDTPTLMFLFSQFKWKILFLFTELIIGICCIIISIFMHMKLKK